jgi:hypothetical protein
MEFSQNFGLRSHMRKLNGQIFPRENFCNNQPQTSCPLSSRLALGLLLACAYYAHHISWQLFLAPLIIYSFLHTLCERQGQGTSENRVSAHSTRTSMRHANVCLLSDMLCLCASGAAYRRGAIGDEPARLCKMRPAPGGSRGWL